MKMSGELTFLTRKILHDRTYSGADRRRDRQLEDRGQDEDCALCGDGGENIPEALDDYRQDPKLYEKICHGIWIRYPTALTDSLQLDFSLESRMRTHRSMTATLM